jgi:hypothetical protein
MSTDEANTHYEYWDKGASRKLKNITLIDYDTLRQLFLAAPGE